MASSNKSQTFKITRKNTELISPAKPTPYEFKYLSNIDNHVAFRTHVPLINFYENNPSMEGRDPVNVIRDAISKALVFYYPFAGRLRECADGKLVVECTGEGVMFVEADADATLHHFGKPLYPPFPNVDELLHESCTPGITNCPLFLFQVTRLKCGGFILAYRMTHAMCDGAGITQFMSAVAELARGGAAPSIPPVWQRHLLRSRRPPHRKSDVTSDDTSVGTATGTPVPPGRMVHRSFLLSAADISALRRSMPPHLQSCSKFDVVAACAWRCWTAALSPKPDENVVFVCTVDIRNRITPPLPVGYYGNGIVVSAAVASAEELTKNPLHIAVDLVREAKNKATDEFVRSFVEAEVMRDSASFMDMRLYAVSDLTSARLGIEQVDVGWGKAVYGGVAKGVGDWTVEPVSWYIPFKDEKGEEGIILPVYLPPAAMEVFVKQLRVMITTTSNFNISAL